MKEKALRKLWLTTMITFTIITIYTIPLTSFKNNKVVRTNLEIEEKITLPTESIYLVNEDNYLVKTEIPRKEKDLEKRIKSIINYLTIGNKELPMSLHGYLPKDTKVISIKREKEELIIDFTKKILNTEYEKQLVSGLTYSLLELEEVNKVTYLVEGKEWYKELTKNLGINEIHNWTDRNQITKVVLYYLDKNNKYYVPVTKYSNDQREKIEIIIEELKKTEEHLISLENIHTELLDYKEEANVLFLNFNSYLIDENTNSQEKLLNTIAYSVFASYDVNMVMFEINHKKLKYVARNNKIN